MERSKTSDGYEIVRSTVVGPGTDTTPQFMVRVVECEYLSWKYRVDLYTVDDDGGEDEVLDDMMRTKTMGEADRLLNAMGRAVISVLGKIGLYAAPEGEVE